MLQALSGLLLALFVAILSSTIVSNALPRILGDLGGSQAQYTWVVTASLLAMTASTPIWGKLADLFSKKLLVQIAITVFITGSVLCGISTSTPELIAFRVLQGLGMGGLMALAQVVIAAIIPPRERGRYSGYLGAIMAVATVGGPLIGGVIVDSALGWRWCFFVTVPLAAVALVVLQKTLTVPTIKREVHIDYLGAILIAAGVSFLLLWTSLGGQNFDWVSWTSLAWGGGGVVALALAVFVESRVKEPIIPLYLFRQRTVVLAIVGSLFVGVAMFGSTVFLSQYFQLARGASATAAGLMTLPLIGGLLVASTVVGQLISRYGRWKRYLVLGGVLLTIGLTLEAAFLSASIPYWQLAIFMLFVGLGVGMTQQNLVLAVQNTVAMRDMGSASSTVAFFRSLGGAAGVAGLGAVLSGTVTTKISDGLSALGIPASATSSSGGAIPNLATLPAPIRGVIENAYGESVAHVFLFAAPLALIALLAILAMREVPLRNTIDIEPEPGPGPSAAVSDGVGPDGVGPDGGREGGPLDGGGRHEAVSSGLFGTVRRDGRRVGGAQMTVIDHSGRQIDRTVTDDRGDYHLPMVPAGTFMLICRSADQPVVTRTDVPPDGARRDVDLGVPEYAVASSWTV
ncbi:MFS transporter [Pseudonocardia sp. KRD-291]|nr:MFS transporter [Pseudonocardia sp. KRD291]